MKKISCLLFLWSCFIVNGQSTSKTNQMQTLQTKMSVKVLSAYQENTSNKIADLFSYFQMLTDVSLTDDIKEEVIININLLFNNQNPLVIDFTSNNDDLIYLQTLIQKLLVSEPILFKVYEEVNYSSLTDKSWNNNFNVRRTKSGITKNIPTSQTVFMILENKNFGEISKTIWAIFLGEMN